MLVSRNLAILTFLTFMGCGDAASNNSALGETDDPASGMSSLGDAGSDAAPDADEDEQSGGEPSDSGNMETFLAVCTETCTKQAECVGVTAPQFEPECTLQSARLTEHGCAKEGTAEMRCLSTLSCDELMRYGSQGRRNDLRCGEEATAYFAACTEGHGKIPAECANLCARQDECGELTAPLAACEENCVLRATYAEWDVSADCSAAFLGAVGCVAQATCTEVAAFLDLGTTPSACLEREATWVEVCDL